MFAFTRGKTVQKRYGNGTESNGRYGMRYDSCVHLERSIIESLTTVVPKRNGNFFLSTTVQSHALLRQGFGNSVPFIWYLL